MKPMAQILDMWSLLGSGHFILVNFTLSYYELGFKSVCRGGRLWYI